jgi:hypothetical protein
VDCELPYPSDLMAAQWALIEPLLQQRNPKDKAERPSSRAFQGITFKPVPHGRSLERSELESRAIDSAKKDILSRFSLIQTHLTFHSYSSCESGRSPRCGH